MTNWMKDKIIDTRWASLTLGERIRSLELEGYVVIPDLLGPEHIASLKAETRKLETTPVDYSDKQRGRPNLQFAGGAITDLIAHPPTIQFLTALFGDDVVMMDYGYARSEPGHPGISLHADGQPWGSKIFGFEHSCPRLVRVLYYLDDLTPEVSPFRVVPRSHLSLHNDANPYLRYTEHPEQVMVTCQAGSAVMINHMVFHGNYPNTGTYAREMLAIAYRPAWSGPAEPVEPWDAAALAEVPPAVRQLMGDRNSRIWNWDGANKPPDMRDRAPGINPSRWQRRE